MTEFYKINEVAEILNVHRNTVSNWLRDGSFPNAFRRGKVVRIPLSDVEAIKQQKEAV